MTGRPALSAEQPQRPVSVVRRGQTIILRVGKHRWGLADGEAAQIAYLLLRELGLGDVVPKHVKRDLSQRGGRAGDRP